MLGVLTSSGPCLGVGRGHLRRPEREQRLAEPGAVQRVACADPCGGPHRLRRVGLGDVEHAAVVADAEEAGLARLLGERAHQVLRVDAHVEAVEVALAPQRHAGPEREAVCCGLQEALLEQHVEQPQDRGARQAAGPDQVAEPHRGVRGRDELDQRQALHQGLRGPGGASPLAPESASVAGMDTSSIPAHFPSGGTG